MSRRCHTTPHPLPETCVPLAVRRLVLACLLAGGLGALPGAPVAAHAQGAASVLRAVAAFAGRQDGTFEVDCMLGVLDVD